MNNEEIVESIIANSKAFEWSEPDEYEDIFLGFLEAFKAKDDNHIFDADLVEATLIEKSSLIKSLGEKLEAQDKSHKQEIERLSDIFTEIRDSSDCAVACQICEDALSDMYAQLPIQESDNG